MKIDVKISIVFIMTAFIQWNSEFDMAAGTLFSSKTGKMVFA